MAHDMANFADVRIPGTWMQQDSMALAVQAALALMGREAEYSRVACLSTNVFSPAVNPGESCASWWHCQAGIGGRALDLMGGALGFRAERLAVPDVDDPGKLNAEGWDAYRAACTPVVRRALANGAVMLTDGGWEQPGYWNFAGLITEVTPEGVMRGTPAFGKPGVVRKYAGTIWALTPAPVTLTPEQADREMARLAVERAASRAPFGDVQWGVFGLAAMDLIVKQMRQGAGFCVECQGRGGNGWGDALDNLKLLHGSADTAATYLRGRADAWPEAARPHIVAAAGHYAKIAELTRPYLTEATLRPLIGDLATQKTLADEVLAPARTALDEAARALTIALVAADLNAPAAGPTRIDGVPHGRGSGDAFCAGLQALLEHAGVEADYDTLMGEVGTAFIMQASAEGPLIGGALDAGWWPLDPAGLQANLDFVSRAHGRRITCVGGMPNQYPTLFRPVVEASIRAGKPVLVDTNWWEVAIGYEADGTLVTFCPSGKYRETHLNSPWCLAFVVGTLPTLDRKQADLEALRHAIALGRDEVSLPWGYTTGQKAYAIWTAALRDMEHCGQARWHANVVGRLRENRRAAVAFLKQVAARNPQAAAPLEAAIGHYEALLDAARTADLSKAALEQSTEGREKLAKLAERMAGLDAAAVVELERAVAILEGRAPITLTGDGVKQDSAALALQAAAKALGRDVDYTTVAVLLGNSFAPAIVPGEGGECPAWWQMSGREHNLDLAARAMGLRIERLALPTRPDEAWADPKVALAHRKACVPALRAALKTGQAILTSGGWASNWNPKASSPYCYWGVITEVRDDGTITGATLNGRDDNPLDRVDPCWVVSLADPTLTQHDADLAVLRQALNRIFGDRGAYAAPGSIWEPRFGLQAMQVWIGQMRRVPFCTECKERSANCAHACTTTLVEGATLSAAYLRRIAPAFPPEVGAHLLEAAKHYARIAELPRPALTGEGGPSFKQIIGDAAAQRAFADGKLYAISDRLALAGQEIDLALIAHGDPPSGRLFLKGDGMKQDSASLAMVAAARTLGVAADYDDVYALSGNAFSPMVNTGEDCAAWWHVESWMAWQGMPNAAARLGLTTTPLPAPEGADNVARRKAVAPAIRLVHAEGGAVVALGGWQVQAGHGFVPWGWAGVITDARDDGMILGACLNGRTSNPLDTVDRLHQVRKAAAARPEHEAHLTMLRLALVRWYGDAPFAGDAKQRYGARAIDTWIGQMRAVKGFCAGCEEREGKGWTCAVSTAETAIGGATTTAAYLRRIAPSFAEAGRAHLLRAAEHYDRIVALLQPFAAGGYKGLTGDLDRQRAHADTVLVPVRDAYTAAADELAKALAAMPQGPPA